MVTYSGKNLEDSTLTKWSKSNDTVLWQSDNMVSPEKDEIFLWGISQQTYTYTHNNMKVMW